MDILQQIVLDLDLSLAFACTQIRMQLFAGIQTVQFLWFRCSVLK